MSKLLLIFIVTFLCLTSIAADQGREVYINRVQLDDTFLKKLEELYLH